MQEDGSRFEGIGTGRVGRGGDASGGARISKGSYTLRNIGAMVIGSEQILAPPDTSPPRPTRPVFIPSKTIFLHYSPASDGEHSFP
jgi:hypothetical protein